MTLPEIIPLFPLPNVVLFPRMPLPLHVFEPRYREMVRDALRGSRLIGMVLLRGAWEREYGGRPCVFTTGTVGQMVHVEELPDGRYNMVLRGLKRFVIQQELPPTRAYREALIGWRDDVEETIPVGRRPALEALALRYLARLGRALPAAPKLGRDVDDEAFVNFFAQHLELDPLERQALLEEHSTAARAARLTDVLEFRLEELARAGGGPASGRAH
jgi:Lon protease-like protein